MNKEKMKEELIRYAEKERLRKQYEQRITVVMNRINKARIIAYQNMTLEKNANGGSDKPNNSEKSLDVE